MRKHIKLFMCGMAIILGATACGTIEEKGEIPKEVVKEIENINAIKIEEGIEGEKKGTDKENNYVIDTVVNEKKYNANGEVALVSVAEYCEDKLIKKSTQDYEKERFVPEYDSQGEMVGFSFVVDGNVVETDEYVYDKKGNLNYWHFKVDGELKESYMYLYDKKYVYGVKTYDIVEQSGRFDMFVYDLRDTEHDAPLDYFFYECSLTTDEYDELCNTLMKYYKKKGEFDSIEVDLEGDRVWVDCNRQRLYDARDRVFKVLDIAMYDVYKYDNGGKLVCVQKYEEDEYSGEQEYEYDDEGRLIRINEYRGKEKMLEYWYEYQYSGITD